MTWIYAGVFLFVLAIGWPLVLMEGYRTAAQLKAERDAQSGKPRRVLLNTLVWLGDNRLLVGWLGGVLILLGVVS